MATGDFGGTPAADTIAMLRRQLAESPRDIQAYLELVDALAERVDADETRTPAPADADESIELLKVAAELAVDENPEVRAAVLVALGHKLIWRFRALLEENVTPEDQLHLHVGEAISCLRRAWESAAEGGCTEQFISVELDAVLQLVELLRLRYNVLGELEDLSAVIEYEQQILSVLTAADEARAEMLYQLGVDFAARHDQQTGTAQDDLGRAVSCLRELRGLIGNDQPGRHELATRLGLVLGFRVLQAGTESSDEDFAEAIAELILARNSLTKEGDSEDFWLVRLRLGTLCAFRYLYRGGDAEDHDVAVAELSELADHPATPTEQADGCHLTLALLEFLRTAPVALRRGPELLTTDDAAALPKMLGSLSTRNGQVATQVVQRHLDAMSESSAADPQLSTLVRGLRTVTLAHSGQNGNDVSTAVLADAVNWLDDTIPEFAEHGLTTMQAALKASMQAELAHRSGDHAAAAAATDLVTEAAAALDAGHPLRVMTHTLLGGLISTFGPPNSADESSAAIATMERLLAELPDDHPDRVRALTKASSLLFRGMVLNRSTVSFGRVRDMLSRAIERPAANDVNDSLNHFMLGYLNGFQGAFEHDMVLLNSGVDLLRKAIETVPEEHSLRSLIGPGLGMLLYGRALLGGDLENFDAAEFYSGLAELAPADEEPESTGLRHTMQALGSCLAASAKLARNRHNIDPALLDETVEKMAAAIEKLPDEDYARQAISSSVDGLLFVRNVLGLATGHDADVTSARLDSLRAHVDALLATAHDSPEERIDHASDTGIAAMALVGQAFVTRDLYSLDRGIAMLGQMCAAPWLTAHERLTALGCLGMGLRLRYQHVRRRRDLNNAIDRLEQAKTLIQQEPPDGAEVAPLLNLLGDCYHERADAQRRDRHRAVEVGVQALRERANDVLLQNNSERALSTAIAASGEASDVARWCLAAGQAETAVEALELGRGTVLHFATIDAGVPELLRQGGHAALGAEWETVSGRTSGTDELPWNLGPDPKDQDRRARAAANVLASLGTGTVTIPGDLRYRVLEAVENTETYARLLDPPSVADITAALAATGSSAVVYLLPAGDGQPGLALVVRADSTVQSRELPGLCCAAGSVFDAFRRAQRALRAAVPESADQAAAQQCWKARLNDACDWAWTVAMEEVLAMLGPPRGGRPARLILVPLGELGMVPWHAARRRVPGGDLRHACQDVVIAYASSARQFVETSRRGALPWRSAPAVVRVSSGLFFASEEVEEIHRSFYPEGTYLGAPLVIPSTATPTRVRKLLPSKHSAGASLLHIGCHAAVANPPINSFLQLAGGSQLYVRDMLEQARGRPVDADGGLVVLAACASDLTGGAHDEALTLATAFLAAGSAGVVGARWAVDDGPTALFMVMFHYYLNRGYDDPATALRAAQRWMLDTRRMLPDGIGRRLAGQLTQHDLTETANWAAFTYQGR